MNRFKKWIAASSLAVVGVGALAPVAEAASGVLCANRETSVVRYSKTGRCRAASEIRLAVGVPGPAGPVGAAGSFATAQGILTVAAPSYTLTLADAGKMLTSTIDAVIVVPTDAAVPFPVGTRFDIGRLSNYVFVQGATGVKVNGSADAAGFDSVPYQHGLLVKTAANTWVLLRFFP